MIVSVTPSRHEFLLALWNFPSLCYWRLIFVLLRTFFFEFLFFFFFFDRTRGERLCRCTGALSPLKPALKKTHVDDWWPRMRKLTVTTRAIFPPRHYYRKRGSASYIVRQWLLWEGERERERDACDVIDITLKSRVIMHMMITSTARRPNASARSDSEPVERSNFEVHVKTRCFALERSIEQQGRVIDERRWGSGSFAFAGQSAVDHPAAFCWHASSKKNYRPSWCLFPFRMAMVLPLRTAWILMADVLSQASLRDVERQRCWKRGSGDGQRLWDYFTARLSDLQFNAVDKRGSTLTWTVCKAIGGSR